MGKIISIANAKGGVGKTSVVIELAYELSEQGFSVGVVDNDPQCNSTYHLLNQYPAIGIRDAMIGNTPWGEIVLEALHPWKNCVVFPGTKALDGIEADLNSPGAKTVFPQQALAKVLRKAAKTLDYILIDNPPTLGFPMVLSLTAADYYLIPTDCSEYAVEGITSMLKHIKIIREELNEKLEFLGLVVTGFQKGNSNAVKQTIKELEGIVGADKILGKINHTVKVVEAQRGKSAISAMFPEIASAKEYHKISEEIARVAQCLKQPKVKKRV